MELPVRMVPGASGEGAGSAFVRADMGGLHTSHERLVRETQRTFADDRPPLGVCGDIPGEFSVLVVLRISQPVRLELVLPRHIRTWRGGVRGVCDGMLRVGAARRMRGGGMAAYFPRVRRQGVSRHVARQSAQARMVRVSGRFVGPRADWNSVRARLHISVVVDIAGRGVSAGSVSHARTLRA